MNSNKNTRTSHNKDRTKATVAAPVTGAIVTAAILLSGLSLIGSYQQPVLAQQQAMTGAGGTTGAGGGTTGGGTVCILITSNGATAGNTTTTTSDAAAQGGNATITAAGGAGEGNQPEVGFDIQDAITAFQNNGTQGAMLTGAGGTTGAGGGTTGGGTVCILITRDDTAGNTTTMTTTSDAAAQGGNATTTTTATTAGRAGEEGNGSLPEIRTHIQDAIAAFQNSDAQGVMNSLDLADKALGGAGLIQDNNMTAAETAAEVATNMTTTGGAP